MSRIYLSEQLPALQSKGARSETVLNLSGYLCQVDNLSSIGFFAVLCVLYERLNTLGLDEQQGRTFLLGLEGLEQFNDEVWDNATKEIVGTYESWNNLSSRDKVSDVVLALAKLHKEVSYVDLMDIFSGMLQKALFFEEVAVAK